jgi:hypothetical protein
MSDENRFFRFIWRFNALALALAILGFLAMAGYGFWSQYYGVHEWEKPMGQFTPVPKAAEKEFTYRIEDDSFGVGGINLNAGETHERILSLKRWQGPPRQYGLVMKAKFASSGRNEVEAVNLLIVNTETGASHWMFKGYDRLILTEEPLYATEPPAPAYTGAVMPPVIGIVLAISDKDTNGGGQIDEKDAVSLYFYRAGAVFPMKFLTADTILSTSQIGSDRYMIVYETGKSAFAAVYVIDGFKLISRKPLPNVPN